MRKKSSPLKHVGLLLLRVGFAGAMITHGWPKLQKLISGGDIKFLDLFGIGATPTLILAVLGELVLPILIIIGFKTKISALFPAITMAVAFFYVHAGDPFKDREMSFVYLLAFVTIALVGAGKFSIDGASRKRM